MPKSDEIVHANCTLTTEFGGRTVQVQSGEPWAADDPFVRANPSFFGADPRPVRRTVPKVETAARRGPGSGSSRITGR